MEGETFDPSVVQSLIGLGGTLVVVGLTEAVKNAWPELEKRWWPLVAIFWGLLLNVGWALASLYAGLTHQNRVVVLFVAVLLGIMAGLAASGLYSGTKAVRSNGNGPPS